jgi:hypothetical protein
VVVEETASVVVSLGNTITVLVIEVTPSGTTVSGTETIDGEGVANTVVAPVRVVTRIIEVTSKLVIVLVATANPEPATRVVKVTDPSLQIGETSEKVESVQDIGARAVMS